MSYKTIFKSTHPVPDINDTQWLLITNSMDYYIHPMGFVKHNNKLLKMVCSKGYVKCTITFKDRTKKILAVHRLVALHFLPKSNKPHVNHKNGVKFDNSYENIEWVTPSENESHSHRVLGKQPPMAKLSKNQKLTIVSKYASGDTLTELSRHYNVTKQAIYYIVRRSQYAK